MWEELRERLKELAAHALGVESAPSLSIVQFRCLTCMAKSFVLMRFRSREIISIRSLMLVWKKIRCRVRLAEHSCKWVNKKREKLIENSMNWNVHLGRITCWRRRALRRILAGSSWSRLLPHVSRCRLSTKMSVSRMVCTMRCTCSVRKRRRTKKPRVAAFRTVAAMWRRSVSRSSADSCWWWSEGVLITSCGSCWERQWLVRSRGFFIKQSIWKRFKCLANVLTIDWFPNGLSKDWAKALAWLRYVYQ